MLETPSLAHELAGEARRFRQLLECAASTQASHLAALLARNQATVFGREHGFAEIRSAQDYARQVPVRTGDHYSPWVDRAAAGEGAVLTSEPILAFEETGGSTGGAKLVPCTAGGLAEFQAGLRPWLDDLITRFPALDAGRFYWSISPACRSPRTTPGGLPIGLGGDAAYFGAAMAPLILRSLAVGPEVGALSDMGQWRQRTLEQLLACEQLAMISVWSPTFLQQLLDHLPASAGEPARIWPRLAVISCWDQAASAPFAQRLREAFPGVHVQGKGLLATEGLVSVPLVDHPWPVLSPASGYFEFKDDQGGVHGIEGLREGDERELIISNANGLYRYGLGDRVRVRGFIGEAPMLEFLGRGHAATDLCGEKLSEAFVMEALRPLRRRFAALALDARARRYQLVLDLDEANQVTDEELLDRLERMLSRNPQYAYARRLGQLLTPSIHRLPRPVDAWTAHRQARGQRLGDIKPPVLIGDVDWQALVRP